jgi:hypothetical protein
MKKVCLLIFLTANLLPAQKIVQKSIIDPEIRAISIDAGNSFELSVQTVKGGELVCEAIIDGEYKKDLLLNVRESGKTILISTGFSPDYKKPNDKLGVHKVVSIALKVTMPDLMAVRIFGTSCNVSAEGSYRNLKITLNDGGCVLDRISGSAKVVTQSGTISVTAENAVVEAKSKYGAVRGEPYSTGEHRYDLSSVTGDILLNTK